MQRNQSIKTDIHNQETADDSETKCCECWENYAQTTKENDWMKCVSCTRSVPQTQMRRLRQKVTAREEQQDAEEDLENFVRCDLDT